VKTIVQSKQHEHLYLNPVAKGNNTQGEDKHVSTINDNSNKALMYVALFITMNIFQVAEI